MAAQRLNSLDANTRVYIISLFDQHPTVRFLTHNQSATTRLDTTATLPLVQSADAGMALILDAERKFLYDEARRLYPDAQHEEVQAPFGSPTVLYYVKITPEEVAALQGLDARYFAGGELAGQPAVVRKEGRLDLEWSQEAPLPLPFVAEWQGVLVAESYGPYQFGLSAPGRAELYVDERLALAIQENGPRDASVSLILPRGHHSLRVTAQGAEGTMRLQWRSPDGAPSASLDEGAEALPAADVFVSPVSNHGLLGRYFPNGEWSGSEALAQIDTRFEMYFHIVPLSRPYTVEWTGKIAIPEAGNYGFGLASVDESSLAVDGAEVASSAGKGDYATGNVELVEGLHDIRIRYADRTNHTGISVYWTPPGSAGRQIIPTAALFPPQGDYSRVELPSFDDLWGEDKPAPGNVADGARMPADVTVLASGLARPAGLAILKDGQVAVAVPDEPTVWVIDTANNTREALTRDGENFVEPFDVAMDSHGKLYVLDAGAGRVSLFDSDLAYVRDLAIDESHAFRAARHPRGQCGCCVAGGYVRRRGGGFCRGWQPAAHSGGAQGLERGG